MGWDQIANALGGVLLGSLAAIVAWIYAIRGLGAKGRLVLTGLSVAGAIAIFVYLRVVPAPVRPAGVAVDVPPPPVAPFSFQLGVADGLAGPVPGAARLPWQMLRVASNLSLDYTPLNRPNQHCQAIDPLNSPEGIAALTELRDILSRLPADIDCGEPCPACDEVGLQWFLDQERFTLSLTDRCWRTHEQIQPLRVSIEAIVARYGAQATCEPTG